MYLKNVHVYIKLYSCIKKLRIFDRVNGFKNEYITLFHIFKNSMYTKNYSRYIKNVCLLFRNVHVLKKKYKFKI